MMISVQIFARGELWEDENSVWVARYTIPESNSTEIFKVRSISQVYPLHDGARQIIKHVFYNIYRVRNEGMKHNWAQLFDISLILKQVHVFLLSLIK